MSFPIPKQRQHLPWSMGTHTICSELKDKKQQEKRAERQGREVKINGVLYIWLSHRLENTYRGEVNENPTTVLCEMIETSNPSKLRLSHCTEQFK